MPMLLLRGAGSCRTATCWNRRRVVRRITAAAPDACRLKADCPGQRRFHWGQSHPPGGHGPKPGPRLATEEVQLCPAPHPAPLSSSSRTLPRPCHSPVRTAPFASRRHWTRMHTEDHAVLVPDVRASSVGVAAGRAAVAARR